MPEVTPQTSSKPKGGSLIKAKMLARTVSRVFSVDKRKSSEATKATAAAADEAADESPIAALEKEEERQEEEQEETEDAEAPVTRGSFAVSDEALAQLPKASDEGNDEVQGQGGAEEAGATADAKEEEEAVAEAEVEAEETAVAEAEVEAEVEAEETAEAQAEAEVEEGETEETRDTQSMSIEVVVPPSPSPGHLLSDTAPLPPSRQSSEMVTAPRESTDMSMAVAPPAPLVKSGSKASHVFGSMLVTVEHSGFDSGHPLFSVTVAVDGEAREGFGRAGDRFATFRNLALQLDLIDVAECPFPKTFLKNKFGVKLTQSEVGERAASLQTWFNSLVEADLPKAVMQSLLDFFTKQKGARVKEEVAVEEKGQVKTISDAASVEEQKAIEEAGAADVARASMRLSQ